MKRNWKLVACLLMALVLLSSCTADQSPEEFPDITQAIGPTATPTAVPVITTPPADEGGAVQPQESTGGQSIFSANPYDVDVQEWTEDDIRSEENYIDPEYDGALTAVEPQGTVYPYAGSTPIPIDPVDMPTPTPRPELKFTYSKYIASTVGVTFEAPVNWSVDESQAYMFILAEPASQIRDGQQCIVTISAEPVSNTYSERELKTHVEQRLDTLYSADYTEWKPSYTATRHMMGATGVYANYSATTSAGVEVGGRIQYVSIDNMLYGLEIIFPLGFKDDFIDVFGQIRTSMSLIR